MSTINGFSSKNGYGNPAIENRSAAKPGSSAEASTAESSIEDSAVNLSSGATTMQKLTQSLASTPSFDQAKVDRIKALIADRQYTVDPAKIAAKFMSIEPQTRTNSVHP
ncbi:MAG: flagellar biosynthesis anti-sigma factor FlgM [Halothiobacillus sp.]